MLSVINNDKRERERERERRLTRIIIIIIMITVIIIHTEKGSNISFSKNVLSTTEKYFYSKK